MRGRGKMVGQVGGVKACKDVAVGRVRQRDCKDERTRGGVRRQAEGGEKGRMEGGK